jgi:peptidase M28-like protein
MKRVLRIVLSLGLSVCFIAAQQASRSQAITADTAAALERISANSLRGHLSFIASDALEGRNTPSRGLDIAAEYIAAQFRRAGLEPAGDDGYFQTANWLLAEQTLENFELKLVTSADAISIDKSKVSLSIDKEMQIAGTLFKADYNDAAAMAQLKPEAVEGKIVLTEIPDFRRAERSRWTEMFRARNEFLGRIADLKAAMVLSVDRVSTTGAGGGPGRLIDPDNRRPIVSSSGVPVVTVHDARVVRLIDDSKPGPIAANVSFKVGGVVERPIKLHNVIGILRGSDSELKNTYVLVTAHYDHVGMDPVAKGDNIYNGANDDGSGTVSVIELASALAALKERPKRSIVFMTFFGEEKGLLGSRYYGRHPVFPIAQTVADINLEQVGRTDSSEGPQVSNASLTGFDYSDVGPILKAAGELTGVAVYKHQQNSDAFFGRSDNQALADQGVPAHTLCVAYLYPDYHGLGDHWDKIDYDNMAKVDRMVALGLIMIANNADAPKWNEANAKTDRYVKAWKTNHGM